MSRRLYVGNLNYQTDEETLREAFADHGTVIDATIISGRGFGFVEMSSQTEADAAREALNGVELDGRRLRVDTAHERSRRRSEGGFRRDRW